jgi:dTDP-glucose 4,6-dehydratase
MENKNKTKVLITGLGGFCASHFMDHFLVNTDWDIIGIDSWRHKGVPERILTSKYYQENKDRVTIYTHDLNSPLSKVLIDKLKGVDYIVNLASMSHVDTSITDPVPFVQNNVNLVLNMLELAREIKPKKFIQFSTDEVYGPMLNGIPHPEWDPILPSNPYSASKAAQEAIAISYWRTYSVPLILTNTMNIIGEKQDGEKFLPKIVKNVKNGTTMTIHAQNGVAGSRFYLHARNAADAILFILKNVDLQMFPQFNEPVRLNVVGKTELNNLELAKMVANIMGKELKYEFVDVHTTRPGHDPRYGLDGTKLKELGYDYPVDFDESLKRTIEWMLLPENEKFLEQL